MNLLSIRHKVTKIKESNFLETGIVMVDWTDHRPLYDKLVMKKQAQFLFDKRVDKKGKICAVRCDDNSAVLYIKKSVQPVRSAQRYSQTE